MKSLHNNFNRTAKSKKRKNLLIFFLAVCVFLFLAVSASDGFLSSIVINISRPFARTGNFADRWVTSLETKNTLQKDNEDLKEQLKKVEARLLTFDLVKKENEELKNIMMGSMPENFLTAPVLSRPPLSPYDVLVIEAGADKGIETGMKVVAYNNVILGYVDDVFSKTSKIKLISFPGEKTDVLLLPFVGENQSGVSRSDAKNIFGVVVGMGGENFEMTLPRAVEVKSGQKVATVGENSLLAGVVEKVQIDLSDPFQKILFRLPLNIQELKYVMIEM